MVVRTNYRITGVSIDPGQITGEMIAADAITVTTILTSGTVFSGAIYTASANVTTNGSGYATVSNPFATAPAAALGIIVTSTTLSSAVQNVAVKGIDADYVTFIIGSAAAANPADTSTTSMEYTIYL